MRASYRNRSIPEIVSDLLDQFPTLLRKEARLARAEMTENVSRMGAGLLLIVVGAVLAIPAMVILFDAIVTALIDAGFEPAMAALITGGVALVIGIILLAVGASRLKMENVVPSKTIHQIQEDASVVKQQVRPDHEQQRAA